MEHRKTWAMSLTIVLGLLCLSFQCGGGGDDPRRKYARASDTIAGSISTMIDVKRDFAQNGRITADEERRLTELLLRANEAATVFNNRVKTVTVIDAGSRAELGNLFAGVTSAIAELNSSGVLGIQNADAKSKLSRIIGSINAAIAIITQLQSQPLPSPTPMPSPTP